MSDSFVTPWTVARQAPLSMGLPRQEYWSELQFPPAGDPPDPEIVSLALAGGFPTTSATWEALKTTYNTRGQNYFPFHFTFPPHGRQWGSEHTTPNITSCRDLRNDKCISDLPFKQVINFSCGGKEHSYLRDKGTPRRIQTDLVICPWFTAAPSYTLFYQIPPRLSPLIKPSTKQSGLISSSGLHFLMKAPMSYKTYVK